MGGMDRKKSLAVELEDRKIQWPPQGVQYFVPNGAIDELFTRERIEAELKNALGNRMERLEFYATTIFDCGMRLFVILHSLELTAEERSLYICQFIDNGITDADLPFHPVIGGVKHGLCSARSACGKGHSSAPVLSNWQPSQLIAFYREQWGVLAPVFEAKGRDGEIPRFDFEKNTIMPFAEDYESSSIQGGHSRVWPVRIVAEHQKLYKPKGNQGVEPFLAVKQLTNRDEDAFNREGDMLSLITSANHKHLVKLLATYRREGMYHLLFPFAEANLRTFWATVPTPNWNRATYLWALDQMTGLADALSIIHEYDTYKSGHGKPDLTFSRFLTAGRKNVQVAKGEERYGRHGDIKPDNMLWRTDESDPKSHGILIITDLGLGEFHSADSKSRINPNKLGGSQTYIAPELALQIPVSRSFDIWGLGCVYLEFITWLVTGFSGLGEFHEVRLTQTPDPEVMDDAYFTLLDSPSGVRYADVSPAVVECMKSLRSNEKCSGMIGELLDLVEGSMLLIDPKARISARKLYNELKRLLQKSKGEGYAEFLAGANPKDEGKGFKTPERPFLKAAPV